MREGRRGRRWGRERQNGRMEGWKPGGKIQVVLYIEKSWRDRKVAEEMEGREAREMEGKKGRMEGWKDGGQKEKFRWLCVLRQGGGRE